MPRVRAQLEVLTPSPTDLLYPESHHDQPYRYEAL
jgi:hypothetical protein